MNKKVFTLGIVLLVVAIVGATAALFLFPYEPSQPPAADDAGATSDGIQQVVDANNQFAFDLYSRYKDDLQYADSNIFFSPYSISTALAMTYEGARGKTAEEIKEVFHFPESDVLRQNSAAIYNDINKKGQEYKLSTGNALWAQYDYGFLPEYLSLVEKHYGGKAANVDFIGETEKSRQTINSFIEEQTNGKIKDLIPKGVLDPMTRLVLTNAIYFKGDWVWQFDKSDTQDRDFKVTPSNIIKTPMMDMDPEKATFNYADLEKLQILELPYKGEEISMLILLPKQGQSYDLETEKMIAYEYTLEDIELSAEKLDEYKAQMRETKMDSISLPKFEFDTKYFMKKTLNDMGMPTAFDDISADFSGMTVNKDLFVSDVIHQAYVKVDEEGTEAAAATAVVMTLKSAMPSNVFMADHPFVFIIQQRETGNILFLGRVSDPSE